MRIHIAITGTGSLFGQGIIKSIKMSSLDVRLSCLDFFPSAVGLYWGDSSHLLPDVLSKDVRREDYLNRLIEILKKERAQVLFVGTDFELPILAQHRERVERETGCRVIVSSPEVIEIGDDKWATNQFLLKHGFPAPPSCVDMRMKEDFIQRHGFPLVIKPRRGSRSHGVTHVRSAADLEEGRRAAGPDPILQRSIGTASEEYTCGAMVFEGTCTGVIAMRRDLKDGNTYRAYVEPMPSMEAYISRVAEALQPTGPSNFQLRKEGDQFYIFEINTRFSGTTVIRALSGFNEVEAVVRWAVHGEKPALTMKRPGVYLRYWEELFVPFEKYREMESRRS